MKHPPNSHHSQQDEPGSTEDLFTSNLARPCLFSLLCPSTAGTSWSIQNQNDAVRGSVTRTNLPKAGPRGPPASSILLPCYGGCSVAGACIPWEKPRGKLSASPRWIIFLLLSPDVEVKRDKGMRSSLLTPRPFPTAFPASHLAPCTAAAPWGPFLVVAAPGGRPEPRGHGEGLSGGFSGAVLAGGLGPSSTRHKCRQRAKRSLVRVCVRPYPRLLFFCLLFPSPFPPPFIFIPSPH